MSESAKTPAKKDAKKNSFFTGVKAEFKKIIWPDKNRLFRESTAVIVATVLLGAVIALFDLGVQSLINLIL